MRKLSKLFIVFLINLCISPGYCDQGKKLLGEEISNREDPREFLPFKMAIPEHFMLHQLEAGDWLLFGDKNTLEDLDNRFTKNPDSRLSPLSGIIRMRLSCDVAQVGPKMFSISNTEVKKQIKKMGGTRVHIRDLSWGEYPLKIVEATVKGSPLLMGWVGLNSEGPVLCINYMFPKDKKPYQHDFEIWNRFINETKARSPEELKSALNNLYQSIREAI